MTDLREKDSKQGYDKQQKECSFSPECEVLRV